MCGFAGVYAPGAMRGADLEQTVAEMAAAISHRGPDDHGLWCDQERGIGLGFRRLSIIDLSANGHQPMESAHGRFWMVFNGEIYNYTDIRADLEHVGARFRGGSDTEVILAAFEHWGIEQAVRRFVGMFAIAVWDTGEHTLTLIRDRLGIKPLFVYARDGVVAFGSEMKALMELPGFDRTLDLDAVAEYLRHLYVSAPRSMFKHVSKIPPGHLLRITRDMPGYAAPEPYWSLTDVVQRGLTTGFSGTDEEALDELERLLRDAVRLRLRADVPLGALLSGGVDSSLVVALMQQSVNRPVKTFSIGFEAEEHNEAPLAASVARHLGTDHSELVVTGADALNVVPLLPELFDEPHADTSQVPAFLICALARQHVTVALSGDGGDEIFGGYNRYAFGEGLLRNLDRMPRFARRLVAAGLGSVPVTTLENTNRLVNPLMPRAFRQRLVSEKLAKLQRLVRAESAVDMYRSLVSVWPDPEGMVPGATEQPRTNDEQWLNGGLPRLLDRMMLTDQSTYLPDDQLAKVDRVSMAVGLEVRVPLIDHRLVEFSWSLPAHLKVDNGLGKVLLRRALYRQIPRALVERPKMGLSVPLGDWLRGPLRSWAEDLIAPDRMRREGVILPDPVQHAWSECMAGKAGVTLGVWGVLMFQAWHERWLT